MFLVDISDSEESINSVLLGQKQWWRNFCNHCGDIYDFMNSREGEPFTSYGMIMIGELAKYNCADREKTMLLEFETEADAIAFILRFS